MKIAFTGHRPNKLGNDYDLVSEKIKRIESHILDIVRDFICAHNNVNFIVGGALGIDTLAALIAVERNISFTLAIPCLNQDKMWPQKSKDRYKYILSKATKVVYVSDKEYDNQCMQRRNIWMVDECDVLIAVWDGTKGGTGNCVNYAHSVGKKVIIIKP